MLCSAIGNCISHEVQHHEAIRAYCSRVGGVRARGTMLLKLWLLHHTQGTPLHIASNFVTTSCLPAILRLGAKFNLRPVEFDSRLRMACKCGCYECVQELRVVGVGLFQTPVNPL